MASVALAMAAMLGSSAQAQVTVPKYRSPLEAPAPQPSALPTPPAITTNATVVEYPVARVNDAIIDNSDYQRALKQLEADAPQMNLSPAQLAEERRNVLRDLIDTQLLLSRGKELEINADAEVVRRLDAVRKEYHFDTMEDLQKAVRESGTSFEDFQANIKNQIITQEVIGQEVGRKLTLSPKEEQAYYDQHKQEFAQPEQVRLSEILIPTPDDATDEQIAQAQAKADQVAAKLKAGAKFEDLAKQYSGGQTASQGGDLGEFKRGALAKVLEDQTFSLKPGEFTAPIRTRQGFVVLQVTEHTQAGIPAMADIDEQLKQAIYEQAMGPALRAYLTGLREKAYINIEQGFVDTGASPRQTKAVFAEATPLPVKKKTEQKERMERPEPAKPVGAGAAAGAAKPADTAGTTAPAGPATSASGSAAIAPTPVATGKKRKKIRREKIRFGQAPRKSLPAAPEETLTPGADQGPGATASALPAPGAQMDLASSNTADANADPLGAARAERGKTRFSDRAATEAKTKAEAKAAKVQQKASLTPTPLTPEEQATQKVQSAALGLNGDTTPKKKKTKVKGAAKERIQEQPPAPPKPAPQATPIPPKSVRDNGEPVVSPPPSNLPPVAVPGSGGPANSTPAPPPAQ